MPDHPIFQFLLQALGILSVPLLVVLNGFFVAAEFSLVTVRWTRVEELVKARKFGAKAVHHAVEKLDDAIAATQLGITFATLSLGWLGEPALAHLFEPLFQALPGIWSAAATHAAAVAVAFLLITFLHVVLGELAPKALALQHAEDVALFVAGPLLVFGRIFRPFIWLMNGAGNWVVRQLKVPRPPLTRMVHSAEELMMLVEETEAAGIITEDQASYVQNVFRLSDKRASDVMVPREDVVSLSLHASEEEILTTCRESSHARLPVWEDHPDNVVGIVNTRNLFRHVGHLTGPVNLMGTMDPPIYAGPDQSAARLLLTLRRDWRPMVAVRDDAGKFLGIVTLENILEELVGEIEAEHTVPSCRPPPKPQSP